jgi:hypothetical protein
MHDGFNPSSDDAFELTGRALPASKTIAFANAWAPCSRNHAERRTIRCMIPNTTRAC